MIGRILNNILGDANYARLRKIIAIDKKRFFKLPLFSYDIQRLWRYSGISVRNRNTAISDIIMHYHVLEKGLTMPNRHFPFGVGIVNELIDKITAFEEKYGTCEQQVTHAVGVVKEYYRFHVDNHVPEQDITCWSKIHRFVDAHPSVDFAKQPHVSRDDFYKYCESPFPQFAYSRHSLRHYSTEPLRIDRIKASVELATTTPTACNRQHCHVYCIANKNLIERLLAIQVGNRGFGHLADKLLMVTANLECIPDANERNDLYTNGGMFLMNLCYALFYHKIAHCILNWSRTPEDDLLMRKLVPIRDSESVIAMLTCGEPPDVFDVCASPRKSGKEILSVIE